MTQIGLIKRPPELDVRKTVHMRLLPDSHAGIRMLCTQKGISMQELFEEFVQRVLVDDPKAMSIVDQLVKAKKERYYRQLSGTDAESLFDLIEMESPLSK